MPNFGKIMHSISDCSKNGDKVMGIEITFLGSRQVDSFYLMSHHQKHNLCNKQQMDININECYRYIENTNNISSGAIPFKQNIPKDIHKIPNIGDNNNTNQVMNKVFQNTFLSSSSPLIKIPLKLVILSDCPPHNFFKNQQFMISIQPQFMSQFPISQENIEKIKHFLKNFFKQQNIICSRIFVWIGSEKQRTIEGLAFRNMIQIQGNGKSIITLNQEFYKKCRIVRLKREILFKDLKNLRKQFKKTEADSQPQTFKKSKLQVAQQQHRQSEFTPKFSTKNLEVQLQVELGLGLASQPSSPKYETPPQTPKHQSKIQIQSKAFPQYVYQTPKKKSTKWILEQQKQKQDEQQFKDLQKIRARVQFIKQELDQKLKRIKESNIYFQQDKIGKGRQLENSELGNKNYTQNNNDNENQRENQETLEKSNKKLYKIKSLKIRPQLQQIPKSQQQFFQQQQYEKQQNLQQKQQNGLSIIQQHESQSQSLTFQKEQPSKGLSQSRRRRRKQSEFQNDCSIYQEQDKDEQEEKQNLIAVDKQHSTQNQKFEFSFLKPSWYRKPLKYHKFPISDQESASNQDLPLQYKQQSLNSLSNPISTASIFPPNLLISSKDGYIIWLKNTQILTQNACNQAKNRPQYCLQLTKNCIKISDQLAKQEAIVCFYCLPQGVERYRVKCQKKYQMKRRMGIENGQKGYEHQIKKKIQRKLKKCVNEFNKNQRQGQSDFETKHKGQMFRFVKYVQIKMKEGNQILSNQNSGKIIHYWYLHIRFI